jgi:hypothetical protein
MTVLRRIYMHIYAHVIQTGTKRHRFDSFLIEKGVKRARYDAVLKARAGVSCVL